MRRGWARRSTAAALAALFAAFCASCASVTGGRAPEKAAVPQDADIAALSRALETEREDAVVASLLLRRGHACLEEAERVRGGGSGDGKPVSGSVAASRLLLQAMRDFEDVAQNFPRSPEAPEALYHLGVVYDYPNLAKFDIAIKYYRRTIETYPDTESAGKARAALGKIDAAAGAVGAGRHGKP